MTSKTGVEPRPLSVEEFWALPTEEGWRLELARGCVVREPAPGMRHGNVASRVVGLLRRAGEENGRGLVFVETAFALATNPATVRVPDVAFVAAERIPAGGLPEGFGEGAPDLAVEVVSPSNRASEMQQKALDYLRAGAGLVWIVDPVERTVAVYRSRLEIQILVPGDILDGGEVLPELRAPVEELFEGI